MRRSIFTKPEKFEAPKIPVDATSDEYFSSIRRLDRAALPLLFDDFIFIPESM